MHWERSFDTHFVNDVQAACDGYLDVCYMETT